MKKNTIVGSAILVMLMVLLSKCLGFLRQIVIASEYGADINTDLYFISGDFMIALSGALLAALSTALVTVYIDISVKKSQKCANETASKTLTLFLVASVILVVLMNIFSPVIAKILAPSYTAETLLGLSRYLKIFSLILIFTAFQSVYAAILNSNNSFVPGKLYGILYNPVAIILVFVFGEKYGITALVWAYFAGNILHTLAMWFPSRKYFSFKPVFDFKDENIKKLIILSVPLLLSNIFIQLNGIIDKSFCSFLGEGAASNYSYAHTLEQFVTATITATVSLILLSRYATYVSRGDTDKLIKSFKNSLSALILLLAPITIIACTCAYEISSIVYLRGEFDLIALTHTSRALIGFCIGFIPIAIREMYIRVHFSYQDSKTPMLANIAGVGLNAVLNFVFSRFLGILGITLATSLSSILTIIILNKSVKKHLNEFKFTSMSGFFIKVIIASIITAIACELLRRLSFDNLIVKFMICSIGSVIVYVLSLVLLKCNEFFSLLESAKLQIMDKFKK